MNYALLVIPLLAGACSSDATEDSQTSPTTKGTEAHPLEVLYLAQAPAGAIEVNELRALENGAQVTVRADVVEYEPVDGKAVMQVYDHSLKSCDEMGDGDDCQTPWDF